MKIIEIAIMNYRNLDGVKVFFAEDCNFIVGENNLGKSNLLSLLNTLFSSRAFNHDDFHDPEKPIEISLKLKLSDIEIGHFQDLFDAADYSIINIQCKQINIDDNIEFYHAETNTYIQPSVVRCINYVYYESLRNPTAELNFDKGKGVGRFLKNIVARYLEDNHIEDKNILEQDEVGKLISSINDKISKIKSFKDFGISAEQEDDLESLLSKVVVLKDDKGDNLAKAGYGVQFLIIVTLFILEKMYFIKQQRKDKGVFEDENSKTRSISLVLGLDEPEIHLHPYMQRSLIKYLNSIINNQNDDFKKLVKELFDIDAFVGQILVVTHSPNIILNDFRQIVRLFSEKGCTKIISGCQLHLDPQLQKHLYLQFPFMKEAFFSRCAIFAEGDSEYASFPFFAQEMSVEFDDLGICVIQARGDAVPQLIQLANAFGIPSIGITDKDNGQTTPTLSTHFQTTLRNFEEEIVALIDLNKELVLRKILCSYDVIGEQRIMEPSALTKRAYDKYGIGSGPFTLGLKLADINPTDKINLKAYYLTWFSINKSYPLGKLIGENLALPDIPAVYKKVIAEAKKLALNV
jgi:putative ATP-dependent endonuclease of OLD family